MRWSISYGKIFYNAAKVQKRVWRIDISYLCILFWPILGGESGIPGIGIYFEGVDLNVRLSTGAFTW